MSSNGFELDKFRFNKDVEKNWFTEQGSGRVEQD